MQNIAGPMLLLFGHLWEVHMHTYTTIQVWVSKIYIYFLKDFIIYEAIN